MHSSLTSCNSQLETVSTRILECMFHRFGGTISLKAQKTDFFPINFEWWSFYDKSYFSANYSHFTPFFLMGDFSIYAFVRSLLYINAFHISSLLLHLISFLLCDNFVRENRSEYRLQNNTHNQSCWPRRERER